MTQPTADLLIVNGIVLTHAPMGTRIDNGGVAVVGERIAAVGPIDTLAAWRATETIDAGGGLVMPGLVNTHTHLPMSLFRGLADDLPLMTWLNQHIFPAESAHVDAESVALGARLAVTEMLLSGTTTCCDGYFHEDAVATAIEDTGIRAILAQGVIDYPAPGVPDPALNVQTAITFVERWQHRSPRIKPSIFCHSPYTCSAATLQAAKTAARDRGVLFQIHAAETKAERDQCWNDHRASPIQYLDHLGLLDTGTLLVHGVWLDHEDIGTIAARNTPVSHNPQSNMKLAAGIAPVPAMLKQGVTVGLGTDGCASNNDLDLFAEMDTTAKLHKVAGNDPALLTAREVLAMATVGGARALGLEHQIGTLEPGKQADIIVIDINKPHLTPMYQPESHLVYAARGADVKDVVVAGRRVVENGVVSTVDVAGLMEAVRNRCRAIG